MSSARVAAVLKGFEFTERDMRLRERAIRVAPSVLAAFRALDPADVAARVARDGAEQVALEEGVRVATVRGDVEPARRVLSAPVQREETRAPEPPPPARRRARMLPVEGERHACAHERACLTEIARIHPNAPGASCAPTCAHLQPLNARAARAHLAASRPGDGF